MTRARSTGDSSLDWLFRYDFDLPTTLALWSIAGAVVTTLVLFVYTMGLRLATMSAKRRRDAFLLEWRSVFAAALMSAETARTIALPPLKRGDSVYLLEEWNRARDIVDGDAVDNLIELAARTRIPEYAERLLGQRRLRARILAVQTIGHLRDMRFRDDIVELVDADNPALSITAAMALTEIDPGKAVDVVVPRINERRDWPKNRVAQALRLAGSERISEPMYRAIRAAEPAGQSYLLQFARLVESEVLDALIEDLLKSSSDPGVLNAALKLVSGYRGVPRVARLTQHDAWFVRMQAAKVLGRVGQPEHLELLEDLLDDREWWVRYRAAQAVTQLPFLGPNQLRQLKNRLSDRYARDMLQQCFAEAGLA